MDWMRLRSPERRRPGRPVLLGVAAAAVMLLGACASSAGAGGNEAAGNAAGKVQLSAASGPTSSTPTWSTSVACPSGYQGSAVFSELHADGTTYTTIAPIVDGTNVPFKGTLLGSIAKIQFFGDISDGGTQELFVQCAAGPGGTGTTLNFMYIFITYSADGSTYSTSATAPTGSPVPTVPA
jgi:hypothetical protein